MDAKLTVAIARINQLARTYDDPNVKACWNLVRTQLYALDSAARGVLEPYDRGHVIDALAMAELRRIVEGQG